MFLKVFNLDMTQNWLVNTDHIAKIRFDGHWAYITLSNHPRESFMCYAAHSENPPKIENVVDLRDQFLINSGLV